jgi:quinol monooxygenase YgiN
MSVLVIAEVRGQTAQGYDSMLAMLAPHLKRAHGLVLHSSHASDDGWRVVEIWQSKAQSDHFFATAVAPQLPPGIRPKRTVQPLHSVVLPALAGAGSLA